MKKVLIISYYFPPMGMGGVQRTAKFVKYLPDFGWEPIVVTVKDVVYYAEDYSLLDDIKNRCIVRTESIDPLRIRYKISSTRSIKKNNSNMKQSSDLLEILNQNLSPWLFIPDSKILWLPNAILEIIKLLRFRNVDLVFTTSPPHSAHFIGLWLNKKAGLPWVADFRDNWLAESYEKVPTVLHRKLNSGMVRSVVRNADKIISVSKYIIDDLIRKSSKSKDVFFTLPNGFDKKDFDKIRSISHKKFVITYCGTLNAILNPEVFLRSLAKAIDKKPEIRKKICIRFVGSIYGIDLERMIERYGLNDTADIIGYVIHSESVSYLMSADLLLLLLHEYSSQGMVTGKIFEYLASGKPILAVVPKGDAARLVIKHARGVVVQPDNENGIAEEIIRSYDLWKRGDLKVSVPRWKGLENFDRRNQTKRLAEIFDEIIKSEK